MSATCNCNVCSSKIEFEDQIAGQETKCPQCGMETVLYIAPRPARKGFKLETPRERAENLAGRIIIAVLLIVFAIWMMSNYFASNASFDRTLDQLGR